MTTETQSGKAPSHVAYHVREGKEKDYWSRIGVAWVHKDGKGFNAQIESIPLDGRITFRLATEKKD